MLNKRSFSDVIPDPVWGWRSKKEEARQAEFVKIGQVSDSRREKRKKWLGGGKVAGEESVREGSK